MRVLFLRSVLCLIAGFTLVGVVIRARPYDTSPMQALLLPDGCTHPCFMGVQPGVTSLTDALGILEGSAWVQSVSQPTQEERLEVLRTGALKITVTWNGSQPDFFAEPASEITVGLRGNHIQSLSIPMKLSLADFWLFMGAPERGAKEDFSVNETRVEGSMGQKIVVNGILRSEEDRFSILFGPSLCTTQIGYMVARNAVLMMSGSDTREDTTANQTAPSLRYLIGCDLVG